MIGPPPSVLARPDGAHLAYYALAGQGPTVVWLGGFHSTMDGTKALALSNWATANARSYLRFDYFGHGRSSGAFEDGTIGRWRDDALAVIEALTTGPLVLVGSSMGGWLACLVALVIPERIAGMVLIAPAADFTETLLTPDLREADAERSRERGWIKPSDHDEGGYVITRRLLDEGRGWSILPGPVGISAPVRILQGGDDGDVPWRRALTLAEALTGDDIVFTLIKNGDHRLSRPQDLARIIAAVEELAAAKI